MHLQSAPDEAEPWNKGMIWPTYNGVRVWLYSDTFIWKYD